MFRKYLLINLFLLVGCVASAQDGANPAPGIVIINPSSSGGGGGGTPSGAQDSIQFKVDSSTFGGSNWLTSASNVIQLRPTNYLTENGPFRLNIDSAAHEVGERRDDIFSIGWNQNNEASGKGSTALVFEAYCGPSVGCDLPGQTETYFSLDDGSGHSIRPIGMFQSKDGTGLTSGIFRFDTLRFFDNTQSYQILAVTDNAGIGSVALGGSILTSDASHTDVLVASGNNAVSFASGALQYGRGSANVWLSPGGDGSGIVRAASNHFQISSGAIEDTSGNQLILLASDGPTPGFSGVTGDGEVIQGIAGSSTNLGWHIVPKGSGNIRLDNFSGDGSIFLNTNHLTVGNFPGTEGVTVSGTVCTITAITNGIITAASCTP